MEKLFSIFNNFLLLTFYLRKWYRKLKILFYYEYCEPFLCLEITFILIDFWYNLLIKDLELATKINEMTFLSGYAIRFNK